jgi:uncharacterized membrane protein YphA (DoxX/SURF4 family)
MTPVPSPGKRRLRETATLLARWLLGALFIYLGVTKIAHPAEFLKFVTGQLWITNPTLASVVSGTAPWVEMFCGLWLISGIARDAAALLARWWLGCVFIFMGLHKVMPHPKYFLELVRQYDMVTTPWVLNSIGAALPWFEVFCGLLLLFGVAVRGVALNSMVMLVPFTLLVLKRALTIAATTGKPFCAVKFDCGCGAGEVYICHKLVENAVLLLLSLWLLTGHGSRLCLRFNLLREKAPVPA